MNDRVELKFNKDVCVNPEYMPIDSSNAQNSQATTTIPVVNQGAVDTDMTDKVEFSTKTQPSPQLENKDEKPWYKKAWDKTCEVVSKVAKAAENIGERIIIESNRLFESESIQEFLLKRDLSDDNNRAAANVSACADKEEIRLGTAKFTAKIKNVQMQAEVILEHVEKFDETVRLSYAQEYTKFHPENQIKAAGAITALSCSANTVKTVIQNNRHCSTEVQGRVAGAIADGINKNQNFNYDTKVDLGTDLAGNIDNLDEGQQAEAYSEVAEKLNEYQEVVNKVQYQVANVAKEHVRQATMARLQNSTYENVKRAFTQDAIKKAQEAFKAANGGKISAKQAEEIKNAVEADLNKAVKYGINNGIKEGEKEQTAQKTNYQNVNNSDDSDNKSYKNNDFKGCEKSEGASNPFREVQVSHKFSQYTSNNKINEKKVEALEQCTTVDEFAKCIKDFSKTDLKNIFKNIAPHTQKEMFANTTSVYLQAFMLRGNIVKYEDVKNDCVPGINSQIKLFTMNHDIEYAIARLNG